jgi:hypothetical protein
MSFFRKICPIGNWARASEEILEHLWSRFNCDLLQKDVDVIWLIWAVMWFVKYYDEKFYLILFVASSFTFIYLHNIYWGINRFINMSSVHMSSKLFSLVRSCFNTLATVQNLSCQKNYFPPLKRACSKNLVHQAKPRIVEFLVFYLEELLLIFFARSFLIDSGEWVLFSHWSFLKTWTVPKNWISSTCCIW